MWALFFLLGIVGAAAAGDALLQSDTDQDDADAQSGGADAAGQAVGAPIGPDLLTYAAEADEDGADMVAVDDPEDGNLETFEFSAAPLVENSAAPNLSDLGQQEDLDEVIHSSDDLFELEDPSTPTPPSAPDIPPTDTAPTGMGDAGLFEDLDEHIHSSDDMFDLEESAAFPAPPLPQNNPPEPVPDLDDMGISDHLDEVIHSSDETPEISVPVAPIVGTAEDENLVGTGADDTILGGAGNDTLIGGGGHDLLFAGSGNNQLFGGEGDDTLIGGAGNDTLIGGWGDDLLIAGGGENHLEGGAGNDTLVGVALDAQGVDQSGVSFLNGGAGDDLLIAGAGDVLHGGAGQDVFALGDWLMGQAPAMIMDYTPDTDQIVFHYDPLDHPMPEITVEFDAAQPDLALIMFNDVVIATVANAAMLSSDDITLIADYPTEITGAPE